MTEAQLLARPTADDDVAMALGLDRASDSADFYRAVIEGMRCGILTIDRQGRLLLWNDLACQVLELSEPPRRGARVEDVLHAHPQLARILRESFTMTSLPNREEMDLGAGKTIGFTVSLVRRRDEEPRGAAVFFKDLTHVEHKEEQERLHDRLAALGQMAASLAHEIRNPLAAIEISCSLLKRRLPAEAGGKDLLDKIIGEVRRLNGTITSSLEFVRPLSLTMALSDIGPVLEEALVTAQGRRGKPGIRVERRLDANASPFLMDRGQLRQVFENLFLNAMEAMGESGVLSIETSVTRAPAAPPQQGASKGFDRYLVVRVRDTGDGIAEEHLDKLFYPFFTTKKQGSGVGLSVARKIVDSHHGLIDIESRPGAGAVFLVRLPMIGAAERGSVS